MSKVQDSIEVEFTATERRSIAHFQKEEGPAEDRANSSVAPTILTEQNLKMLKRMSGTVKSRYDNLRFIGCPSNICERFFLRQYTQLVIPVGV